MAASREVRAQQVAGFAVDRFEPAGAGSQFMALESLDFDGHWRPAVGLVSAWAWKPLVVYDGGAGEVSALVGQQMVEHLQAAVVAWNRARFDLDLPVPVVHTGRSALVGGETYAAPEGVGVGDLRLGADVRLFRQAGVTGALGAQLFLPTGDTKAFSSDGGVRFWPRFLVAGQRDRLVWAARLGVHFRPRHACGCDLSPGSELTAGLAGSWRFLPRLSAGPELYLARVISGGPFGARAATSMELLLAAHLAAAPRWNIGAGIAPGLTDGAGTPTVRALISVQYALEPAAPPAAPATSAAEVTP